MMIPRRVVQPFLSFSGDLSIVQCVGRLAGPREFRHFPRHTSLRQIFPNESHQVTLPLNNVHWKDFLCKAVIVIARTEMQFSDRDDLVPRRPEAVMPGRDTSIVWICIIPEADLVVVLPSRESGTCRHTHRARSVRLRECGTPVGEAINVRCGDQLVSVAARRVPGMLVGHNDYEVLWFHLN